MNSPPNEDPMKSTEEGGGHEKLEDIQEEDEDTNETIEEEQNDLEPNQVVVNTPKQLEEESKTGNLEKEVEEEEEEEVEEELEEEEEVEEEEELEEVDENKLGGVDRLHTKQDIPTRVREDSSSTTGSVLSEIQNSPIVGVNQPPLPEPQVLRPSGEVQRKKIVLGCVGIPRDQLPYVKIVWVPTVDIIKAYKKFDAELFKLAHGPDGSSRVNNEDLMARLMEQTTHGVTTGTT
ncbi:histone H3.v1-like [Diaphorina citri]|uniref:Histone H3.v1-like n=1 Tax=Diaphorina citri TaxID=121845 RepID=A0A1S4ERL6_DIACI|nr:histone H3.v1-like [Diaphorina citri]